MKKNIMNKTLIAAAITLGVTPAAMADAGAEPSRYPFSIAIGGGAVQMDAPAETYAPAWLSEYGPDFPGPVTFSNDPGWGHVRELSLGWMPKASWQVSAAYRYGKANAALQGAGAEAVPGGYWAGLKYATDPTDVTYAEPTPRQNHWTGAAQIEEEFEAVDFKVGRDIGIGASKGSASILSVGVRYAELSSSTAIFMDGIPSAYSPAIFDLLEFFPDIPERSYTQYTHNLAAQRHFEGYGPTVSWESELHLIGEPMRGQVAMNWMVAGGVLFGEQTSSHDETRLARYYHGNTAVLKPTSIPYDNTVSVSRSRDATVPHLSLDLGLTYEIQRVQVSLRYSWERYYGAIDAGLDVRKTYDRTVQGPVAKVSIGFGG